MDGRTFKEQMKETLRDFSVEELMFCTEAIKELVIEKRDEEERTYTFEFDAKNDREIGVPYVAKIRYNYKTAYKLERFFLKMKKTISSVNRTEIINVSGRYNVKEGEIIEIRKKKTKDFDYRYFYVVWHGDLYLICHVTNEEKIEEIREYLRAERSLDDLLKNVEETEF